MKMQLDNVKSVLENFLGIFSPLAVWTVITAYFLWATETFFKERETLRDESWCSGYGFLILLYTFITIGYINAYLYKPHVHKILLQYLIEPAGNFGKRSLQTRLSKFILIAAIFAFFAAYLIYDTWDEPERLISAGGYIFFILLGYVFSRDRKNIKWRTIVAGITLQFLFGLFTLRWETGRNIFGCAGDKMTTFLGYAQNGSAFVYGDFIVFEKSVFAFKALATIYFLGFIINILYHWGVMQKVILNLGLLLRAIMGTSICESVNSAANIFLGQSEAPLLLKPYLKDLTASELHAVMTGGFASVSGTVLAAYIEYGAEASHLITASVMAAPAGLVYSKLMFPETEEPCDESNIAMAESEYSSVLDAASQGACQATQIVLGIIANLVAFVGTVFFINGVLSWLGVLVGFPEDSWSLEALMGYVFMPVSFLMGVPWDECEKVGQLIGLKTMVNEFAAFSKFGEYQLSGRTKIITTFALCGFANPGSMGIMISALSALVPHRSGLVTQHVVRAFVSGTVVCFTTACIAGMLSV